MAEKALRSAIEAQQNRACDACRNHKVRCFPDISASSKICQRCARTDRRCVYTAPQKRKQRKRTDTRVAELEREVQAMRSLFEGKKDKFQSTNKSQPTARSEVVIQETPKDSSSSSGITLKNFTSSEIPKHSDQLPLPETRNHQTSNLQTSSISQSLDVIDRGIVSIGLATELFHTYVTDLVPHYPAVVFPRSATAAEIRRTKPTLFLAIIAAASGKSDPSLYSTLNSEVISAYAQQIVIESQKSLELVEALIVTSVWYYPPGKFAQLKFYEYIHMAATMAMDIGLGTKPKMLRRRRTVEYKESPVSDGSGHGDDYEIERRRTFLACYLITTGVSMSMRRPAMLRYNSWVNECLEFLDAAPDAATSDKLLIGWVKLLSIAEEVSTSLSFDDPGNMPSLAEPRVQHMLKSFEKRLDSWKAGLDSSGINDALLLAYYHNNLYLHELALHEDHPPEDFLPPFTIDQILLPDPERNVTSSYVDAISVCISSAHSLIEVMLSMSVEALRALPIFNFARMAYACIILTKLYVSVQCSTSKIGMVLDRETLRLGIYLPAMIERLGEAVGPMECRSPATFLGLLVRLRAWYEKQEMHEQFTEPVKLFGPDKFTPPDMNDSKFAGDFERSSESSISKLTQIREGHQPAAQMQVKFDKMDPFKDFFNPGEEYMKGLTSTSNQSSTQSHSMDTGEDLLFDPALTDFDMNLDFLPEGLESSDVGFIDWTVDMDYTGENGGVKVPEIPNWNSNS